MYALCIIMILCARAAGIPWSTLGVVDDGVTDNTAALNALPVGVLVEGDCPRGGAVLAQGVWLLRSHLFLRVHAGCEVLSNSTGIGSYAISHVNPNESLTNVTLVGLTVAKTTRVAGDRVLLAYIDNFLLLNWTFHHHGGAMFLRGSCQEVAGGSSYDDAAVVGSPGVRHIGNLPKAACARAQPANVWVHHNSIVSGDGAYQACQPLDTSLWVNVGSDDMLWEGNTGGSVASAFILAGLAHVQPQHSAFACTNITFRDMYGSGLRLIYVQAAAPPNVVERIVLCEAPPFRPSPPQQHKCARGRFSPRFLRPLPPPPPPPPIRAQSRPGDQQHRRGPLLARGDPGVRPARGRGALRAHGRRARAGRAKVRAERNRPARGRGVHQRVYCGAHDWRHPHR